MHDVVMRVYENLGVRLHGPLTLRLVLQPLTATFLAVRAGLKDARGYRPAYFWALLTDPANRRARMGAGWKDIARVFPLAVALDVVFQLLRFGTLYPLEALLVAVILAVVPYTLLRGPVNRLARKKPPAPPPSTRSAFR